jgi:hypothetical protein
MKKITIFLVASLVISMFALQATFQNPGVEARRVTQDDAKELETAAQERYAKWKSEHTKQVGVERPHMAVTLVSKRVSASEAALLVTVTSPNSKALDLLSDIDVTVQPLESNYSDGTQKNAGTTIQRRVAKISPGSPGEKGRIATLNVLVAVQDNANSLQVTTKLTGSSQNKSFTSTIPLGHQLTSCTLGSSPPADVDTSRLSPSANTVGKNIANALADAYYTPAQCRCDTISLSCSCPGCPGASCSKSCKAPPCGSAVSSNCNPLNGTCTISCTQC